MKKFHFQVVVMDKRGFILQHIDFQWQDRQKMLDYIQIMSVQQEVNKIEITRWNGKNEKV